MYVFKQLEIGKAVLSENKNLAKFNNLVMILIMHTYIMTYIQF